MGKKPKIGLLPLYLELYDKTLPEVRKSFQPLIDKIVNSFKANGVDVITADVCRLANEFGNAVLRFEQESADCIVTLHLAYSPSLESIDALIGTELPIVVLDVTMDMRFGRNTHPDRIMYNHGIHGVMDMTCMLRRHGKRFCIVAGYAGDSKVIKRAVAMIRGAMAARHMSRTKVLRIGDSFKGMGDFYVESDTLLKALGITVHQAGLDELAGSVDLVTVKDIDNELAADREKYCCDLAEDVHRRSLRVCLATRRILETGGYDAFSMNFLAFSMSEGPVDTVPFLEACKAMARGIGYAGEGDVLTAALVGALSQGFGEVTFTELFCPDWEGSSLFLSHMGEVNPVLAMEQPRLIEYNFPYTPAQNPAKLTCCLKQGPATFVDIVPGPNDSFSLIAAPVEMLGDTSVAEMKDSVRGWMKPVLPLESFLEKYSQYGGTHHSALIMGNEMEGIRAFADFMGLQCNIIS
ncbi:MAG: hypothetical protein JXN60_07710 [Lentisphaerae bacterium]|nr:hypothetical protein [Lentisphaerota bacterium]